MSPPRMLRAWQGWRTKTPTGKPLPWTAFLQRLGDEFIPRTWRVMTRFGLKVYAPTVLQAGGEGLPEEVALLVYTDEQAYLAHKADPEGLAYSASHRELFDFSAGARQSRTRVAAEWGTPMAQQAAAVHRADPSGDAMLESDDSSLALIVVSGVALPQAGQLLQALNGLAGEWVVLVEPGYALLWFASRHGQDQAAVDTALKAALPGQPSIRRYRAQRASLDTSPTVKVLRGSSLYFRKG